MSVTEISARIEALAPDRNRELASVIVLADACFALEGGMSRVFDFPRPAHTDAMPLRQRCLELMRSWLPLLDGPTFKALEARVKDRRTPIDLSARKAELTRATAPDRTHDLAAFRELPPLDGYDPIDAFYVEQRLAIGEWPDDGLEVLARPGVWLAYARDSELLCVHAAMLTRIDELRARATRLPDELPINGARIAVADATAAKNETFIEALGDNDEAVYRGRAAQLFLDGDGHARASVASEGPHAVLAFVEVE